MIAPGDAGVIALAVAACERANAHRPGAVYRLASASDISDLVSAAQGFLGGHREARGHLLTRLAAWTVVGRGAPAGEAGPWLLITVEHRGVNLASKPVPAARLLGRLPPPPDPAQPGWWPAGPAAEAVLSAVLDEARALVGACEAVS